MVSIHAVLLVVSLGALAAPMLAGRRLGQRTGHVGPSVSLAVTGGALAVGNAVCLLPGAPRWYSMLVVVLSVAALVVLLAALSRSGRSGHSTGAARPHARRQVAPRHVPLYAVASPTDAPRDAVVVEDGPFDNVVSIIRDTPEHERRIVTAPMMHAAGPAASHTTVGQGTYVAAHLEDYLPDGSRRRTRGEFRARSHTPATSDAAAMRLRVVRAYGAGGDLRGRLSEHRA